MVHACSINNLETISSFSLEALGNLVGCQNFEKDDYVGYCGCMENLYGNAIKNHPNYSEFVEKLEQFDRQETRIEKFASKSETVMLAALANYLASKSPNSDSPFTEGGACSKRLSESGQALDAHTGMPQDISGLTTLLARSRDDNYLATEGIDDNSLSSYLSNAFSVSGSSDSFEVVNNHSSSPNKLLSLLGESIDSIRGPGSTLMQVTSSQAASQGAGAKIGVSVETAIEGICENLAKRFESSRSAQDSHPPPSGEFIDVGSFISMKNLNPADMPAFRGLKARFLNKGIIDEYGGQDLFFGQLMCSNLDEDSFGDIEGSDDPHIQALDNGDLAKRILNNNSLIRLSLDEYEVIAEEMEAAEEISRQRKAQVDEVLASLGISEDKFTDLFKKLESSDGIVGLVDELLGGAYRNSADGLKLLDVVGNYFDAEAVESKALDEYLIHQSALYNAQVDNDKAFRELASRVGGVLKAHEALGDENISSHSVNFFERFHFDEGIEGPFLPDSLRFQHDDRETISARLDQERRDQQNADAAVETMSNNSELTQEEKDALSAAVDSAKNRTHSKRRIRSFIRGESSIGKLSIASEPSFEEDYESLGEAVQTNSPPETESIVSRVDRDTSSREMISDPVLSVPENSALAEVANSVVTPALTSTSTSRREVQRDNEQELNVNSPSQSELEAKARIADLQQKVEREIKKNKEEPEVDEAKLNTLKRFRSEISDLEKETATLRGNLEKPTPVVTTNSKVQERSLASQARTRRGSAASAAPVETPAQQVTGGGSAVAGVGSYQSTSGEARYNSINAAVDSVVGSVESGAIVTLSSDSLELRFREVSRPLDNKTVVSIQEDFLSLSDEAKLAFIEDILAGNETDGSSVFIKQRDGTVFEIEIEKGIKRTGDQYASSDSSSFLSPTRESKIVKRVAHLSALFSKHFVD